MFPIILTPTIDVICVNEVMPHVMPPRTVFQVILQSLTVQSHLKDRG